MDRTEYGLGAQPHFDDDRSRNYGIAEGYRGWAAALLDV